MLGKHMQPHNLVTSMYITSGVKHVKDHICCHEATVHNIHGNDSLGLWQEKYMFISMMYTVMYKWTIPKTELLCAAHFGIC